MKTFSDIVAVSNELQLHGLDAKNAADEVNNHNIYDFYRSAIADDMEVSLRF